ncbi:MAG: ABC transporter ATP-binding protein [Pirellulaceae bacterium]
MNLSLQSDEDRLYEALRRVGLSLKMPIDRADVNLADISEADRARGASGLLIAWARQVGIYIKEVELQAPDISSALLEGFPVVLLHDESEVWVFESLNGKRVDATCIGQRLTTRTLNQSDLRVLLQREMARAFIAKRELECATLSPQGGPRDQHSSGHAHHSHPSPMRRLLALLKLDSRDIWTIALFALVAGVLALATPLAIESLVNVVSWGTTIQPLLVLSLMLFTCLGAAGFLRLLQTIIVEIIQRRQFVRIIGDLSHRFPRAAQETFDGLYPRELANRLFDIMTIQKATAVLLLDGITIVLTTILGLLLLAFYHPFLLGFDIVLVISMLTMTWLLGRDGIRTAIDESKAKYSAIHWLQDVISMPTVFKVNGGEYLAIERANRLTAEYLAARERQFRVVIRQVAFAIGLQVVASTALLGLGGWLVMRQQLTLGQLIASELVLTVVVGAFAKAGKALEKFYDLMAGIDKVGHLLDIPVDPRFELGSVPAGPAEVRWGELHFHFETTGSDCHIPGTTVAPGARVAVTGDDHSGKSLLLKSLSGLVKPHHGMAEVAGLEAQRAALGGAGNIVAYAGNTEIFHATLEENVDLGRQEIGQNLVREALVQVGLWDTVLSLPDGLRTRLQTDGKPLSRTQRQQLVIARAIAGAPRLLLSDGLLDDLTEEVRETVWQAISQPSAPWTLLLTTNQAAIADLCSQQLHLGGEHAE